MSAKEIDDDPHLPKGMSFNADDEDWILFDDGVGAIRHRLGLSIGAAEKVLRDLCAEGTVRSMRQQYDAKERVGPPGMIRPSAWREKEIDFEVIIDEMFIGVSDDDLGYWLQSQSPEPILPNHPRDAAIVKRLQAGERPGIGTLQWKTFREAVRQDCGTKETERGYSDETIENVTRKLMGQTGRPKVT